VQVGRLRELRELAVRLADELDAEAEDSVEEDERTDELARLVARVGPPEHEGEDAEEDDAFEERLVELARVARRPKHALAVGVDLLETDRPRNGRLGAPQLLVDEVGKAAEEQAERRAAGDIIVDPKPRQLLLVREIEDSERGADDAAVEGHAAVPQLQDLDRVPEIFAEVVEQHVADAAAENDA
jgi:hypothetical protein